MFSKRTFGTRGYKTNAAGLGPSALAKKLERAAKAQERALQARAEALRICDEDLIESEDAKRTVALRETRAKDRMAKVVVKRKKTARIS
jgi:hypothetical protein